MHKPLKNSITKLNTDQGKCRYKKKKTKLHLDPDRELHQEVLSPKKANDRKTQDKLKKPRTKNKTYNIFWSIYQSRTSNPKSPKFLTHELSILPNSNPKDPKPVSTFFMNRRKRKFKTQMCKKAKYFLLDASSSESESTKKLKALCSQKISIFYIFIALTTRSLKESVKTRIPYQHCAKWFFYNYYISPFIDHS